MKKYTLYSFILISLLLTIDLSAQWTDSGTKISTSDNVGIGTVANSQSLYVRKNQPGWQNAFINRGIAGANVYISHGAGYGMHIRGITTDGKYTLELFNKIQRTNIFYNNGNVGLGLAGNVGIGTASPVEKFHVNGNMRANVITSMSRRLKFGPSQYLYGDAASALYWNGNHSTVTQLIMRDKENKIYGRLYGTGDGANFGLLDGDSNWSYLAVKDNYTAFLINNNEKLRIKSNGNVGIGTQNPYHKLTVDGDGRFKNTIVGGGIDEDAYEDGVTGVWNLHLTAANASNQGGNIYFRSGQAEKMVILKDGKVRIGNVDTPGDYKLFVENGIISEKVRVAVENTSEWADHVFEDEYNIIQQKK